MALDFNARKTEHNGPKNTGMARSSIERGMRKAAARKLRRRASKRVIAAEMRA